MNLKKVNKHIIDSVMGKDSSRVRVGKTGGYVGMITDGFCLFLIEQEDFIFDYEKLENNNPFNIENIIKIECETTSVKLTGDIKVINDKQKIVKFANDDKHTFVREKHLGYFSKNCDFRIDETITLSPLYIFKENNVIGVIMPYNVEKKGE